MYAKIHLSLNEKQLKQYIIGKYPIYDIFELVYIPIQEHANYLLLDQENTIKQEKLDSPFRKALKRTHSQANSIDDSLLRCEEKRISRNNISGKAKNKREKKNSDLQNKENLNFNDKFHHENDIIIPAFCWSSQNMHKRHKSGINSSIFSNGLLFDSHCDESVEISCADKNLDKDQNELSQFSISSPNKDKSSNKHIQGYLMQDKTQNFWLSDSDPKPRFLKTNLFKNGKSHH